MSLFKRFRADVLHEAHTLAADAVNVFDDVVDGLHRSNELAQAVKQAEQDAINVARARFEAAVAREAKNNEIIAKIEALLS